MKGTYRRYEEKCLALPEGSVGTLKQKYSIFSQKLDRVVFVAYFLGAIVLCVLKIRPTRLFGVSGEGERPLRCLSVLTIRPEGIGPIFGVDQPH